MEPAFPSRMAVGPTVAAATAPGSSSTAPAGFLQGWDLTSPHCAWAYSPPSLSCAAALGLAIGAVAARRSVRDSRKRIVMATPVPLLFQSSPPHVRRSTEPARAGSGLDMAAEVTRQLRGVKDEGLGVDIVTCGFAGDVEVDPQRGHVSFRLEVSAFEGPARKEVEKLPWVRSIEVRSPATASRPKKPPPAASSQAPMPQMPKTLDKVRSILAVSSCKGGVGKSTVAVNLAFELRKRGAKVGIFDCDVYGPSLPVMVRFPEEPQMEMYEDEEKQKHIVPVIHKETGIKLVSFGYCGKAAVMRGSMVTGLIVQLLTQSEWGELDYLVLDLPPGTGDIHLTLAQVSRITAAVIVTTPQKLSIIDVERGISMFSQLMVPSIAVVQNMSYFPMPDGTRQYPFGNTAAGRNIADTFGIDHVFELPLDPAVSNAGDSGVPFVTHAEGPAVEEISQLAEAVVKEVEQIHSGTTRPAVTLDENRNCLHVKLPNGEAFGIDPSVLRLRDKGAGGATPPGLDARPLEIRDMGNYAIVVRWSDGFVQVAPHKQLIHGDEKGPMPRLPETTAMGG